MKNSTMVSAVDHVPFPRSGNPGYLVGKPVIAAFRVKQKLNANESKDATKDSKKLARHDTIDLSVDPKQWLTLPGSNMNGKICILFECRATLLALIHIKKTKYVYFYCSFSIFL